MVIIVLNLKQLRNSLGLSQAEVASHLNISRAAYTNIENGKRDPDTQTLLALADLLGVSMDAIFGRSYAATPEPAVDPKLTALFNQLNIKGQQLVFDYAAMLAANPDYTKETAFTVSA